MFQVNIQPMPILCPVEVGLHRCYDRDLATHIPYFSFVLAPQSRQIRWHYLSSKKVSTRCFSHQHFLCANKTIADLVTLITQSYSTILLAIFGWLGRLIYPTTCIPRVGTKYLTRWLFIKSIYHSCFFLHPFITAVQDGYLLYSKLYRVGFVAPTI